VLRPDGSTLYTFRDVVYSFKKASQCDLVLNIICRCLMRRIHIQLRNSVLRLCGSAGTTDPP
jgi:arginyl-tRNA synthetase